MTTTTFLDSLSPSNGVEIGNRVASRDEVTEKRSTLVLATYNIRYAVGRYLISSGLLRKAGLNFPRQRGEAVGRNIQTAGRAFSDNLLLPRPDILALQEADKQTARAGGRHVASELAHELGMRYVHVGAGIPRGVKPQQREWWLNFEEQIGLYDPGDTGVALLSRVPLEDVTCIDLPWHDCAWRPRLAMGAAVDALLDQQMLQGAAAGNSAARNQRRARRRRRCPGAFERRARRGNRERRAGPRRGSYRRDARGTGSVLRAQGDRAGR